MLDRVQRGDDLRGGEVAVPVTGDVGLAQQTSAPRGGDRLPVEVLLLEG